MEDTIEYSADLIELISAVYWINLQSLYDLDIAKEKNIEEYNKIHPKAS